MSRNAKTLFHIVKKIEINFYSRGQMPNFFCDGNIFTWPLKWWGYCPVQTDEHAAGPRFYSWSAGIYAISRMIGHQIYVEKNQFSLQKEIKGITFLTSLFIPCSTKLNTLIFPIYISNPGSNFNNKAKKPLLSAPFTSKLNSITKTVSSNTENSLVSDGCRKSKVCPVGIKPISFWFPRFCWKVGGASIESSLASDES